MLWVKIQAVRMGLTSEIAHQRRWLAYRYAEELRRAIALRGQTGAVAQGSKIVAC